MNVKQQSGFGITLPAVCSLALLLALSTRTQANPQHHPGSIQQQSAFDLSGHISAPIPAPMPSLLLGNSSEQLIFMSADGRSYVSHNTLSADSKGLTIQFSDLSQYQQFRLFRGFPIDRTTSEPQATTLQLKNNLLTTRHHSRYEFEVFLEPTSTDRLFFQLRTQAAAMLDKNEILDKVLASWVFPPSINIESYRSSDPAGQWQHWDQELNYSSDSGINAVLQIRYSLDASTMPDSDADNVADEWDRCRDTPADFLVDAQGCALDFDNDNIPDSLDLCPGTVPGTMTDAAGCAADSDADGVEDTFDQCDGPHGIVIVDTSGCLLDEDKDQIPDYRDICPSQPVSDLAESFGCKQSDPLVLQDVRFRSGFSGLDKPSRDSLDRLAASIQYQNTQLADFITYEIAAHTDNRGSQKNNQALSRRRANAVRHYLILRGIRPEQLVARGYGEMHPRNSNKTVNGRARNRRVELKALQ